MVYLDNAATSFPKPEGVVREIQRCMTQYCGNPGRGSNRMALRAAEKLYECRCLAMEMFGATEPENVVFTMNATHALNIAIKGLVPAGSHVLISDMEHNSVLRPVEALRRRRGVTYNVFSTSGGKESTAQRIAGMIKADTSAVICLHASNIVNRVLPIREIGEICKKYSLLFILDASQSAGALDINMKTDNISALCMPGHKGLLGPQGSGMLILADGVLPETLMEGGSGVNSADSMMPAFLPDRLEAGTMPTPVIAGLCEGIKYVRRRTTESIRTHEAGLITSLRQSLANDSRLEIYGEESDGSLLLLNAKHISAQKLAAELDAHGICTRSGLHCSPLAHFAVGTPESGAVRVSSGPFTTQKEMQTLKNVLNGILRDY